ncbi:MAG: hypothetical protein RL748_2653 [Pseudomonadota bacterium]|jgi:tRNA pseudouridine38-40 synthase
MNLGATLGRALFFRWWNLKRIVLGLQYDGAPWLGYQTQPHGCTVQDHLEAAIQQFSLQKVRTVCAGRTDAGVHALEQVVHFDIDLSRNAFSWVRGVNAYLPPAIAVRWACEVPGDAPAGNDGQGDGDQADANGNHGTLLAGETDSAVYVPGMASVPQHQGGFHARFSARARTYHYVLYNHAVRSPVLRAKVGWVFRPLNVELMQQGANYLLGTHDFTTFRAAQCQAKTPVKEMYSIQIQRHGDLIIFTLRASAFLHHMVRNIVGSLICVGSGNNPPEWMQDLLQSRDRSRAAPTFMPDGLYLAKIDYEPHWNLPQESSLLPWFG